MLVLHFYVLLLAYLFISLAIIPNIREGNRKRIELEIKSNNILTEALKSIVDVKLTNAENYFKEKYPNKIINVELNKETKLYVDLTQVSLFDSKNEERI